MLSNNKKPLAFLYYYNKKWENSCIMYLGIYSKVSTNWQNIPCSWIVILNHVLKVKLTGSEVEQCLPGAWSGGIGEKLIKAYKLLVIRWITSGNLIYSIVTIVGAVFCTWNVLREILSVLTTKIKITMWHDGCVN